MDRGTARAVARQVDVSDPDAVRACFAELDREFGRLDVLVNNAGILDRPATVAEIEPERLQRMFAVNVFGAFYCAREAVLRMSASRSEKRRDLASARKQWSDRQRFVRRFKIGFRFRVRGLRGDEGRARFVYVGLSKEVAAKCIRVNAVRPGFIESDIHGKDR